MWLHFLIIYFEVGRWLSEVQAEAGEDGFRGEGPVGGSGASERRSGIGVASCGGAAHRGWHARVHGSGPGGSIRDQCLGASRREYDDQKVDEVDMDDGAFRLINSATMRLKAIIHEFGLSRPRTSSHSR